MRINLKQAIIEKLECNEAARFFITKLMLDSDVYLFGGAIRDFIDGGLETSRDLDFVVKAKKNDSVNILQYISGFKDVTYKKNRYDGYKINFPNCVTVDIWNLNDTWAFRNNKLSPTVENLTKSVYLNIDALVYSLNNETFLEDCDSLYSKIRKNRILDIVFEETPYEDLNLLRALLFQKKYSLDLSEQLKNKLLCYIESEQNSAIENLINMQQSHYNNVILNKNELINIFYQLNQY